MSRNRTVDTQIAVWHINAFCEQPSISTYLMSVLCLYNMIELHCLGDHKVYTGIKDINNVCKKDNQSQCIEFVAILANMRHSIAHTNYSVVSLSAVLNKYLKLKGEEDIKRKLEYLLGDSKEGIDLEYFYKCLSTCKLAQNFMLLEES